MKTFELNDLPQYSGWVSGLLCGSSHKRHKDPQQIIREFGLEKWGALLSKWKECPCDIDVVRQWEIPPEVIRAGVVDGQLMLMTVAESLDCYVNLVERALHEDPSPHLVEVGCGYGSILFELIRRANVNYKSVIGLEYTQQGQELAQLLAAWHNYDVTIGQGDFNAAAISNMEIPPGSDLITSFALSYVRDSALALGNVLKLKPRRVLHFEPVFQHYPEQTVLGLLQRRYLEVNDYNLDFRQELARLEDAGTIEIIREEPAIFGGNCLSPLSLLVWRPVADTEVTSA